MFPIKSPGTALSAILCFCRNRQQDQLPSLYCVGEPEPVSLDRLTEPVNWTGVPIFILESQFHSSCETCDVLKIP